MKTHWSSIVLIIFASLIGAGGQFFFKLGSKVPPSIIISEISSRNIVSTLSSLFVNPVLRSGINTILGLLLYGIGALLLIFALRKGELSVIYPLFAGSYVWVSLISAYYFGEEINIMKWGGIALIVIGISFIGYGSSKLGEDKEKVIERLGIPEEQ